MKDHPFPIKLLGRLGVCIGMCVIVAVVIHYIGVYLTNQRVVMNDTFVLTPKQWMGYDSMLRISRDSFFYTRYPRREYKKVPVVPIKRCKFDPNTADSILLLQQGFKSWQVKGMLSYRRHNGVYKRKEQLKKLYGMTDSMYRKIAPYVVIDTMLFAQNIFTDTLDFERVVKKDTILNLNTADTTELMYIRYIGRATAVRIVMYRQRLGGFIDVEQLREIKGLSQTQIDSIKSHFFVDTRDIVPMNFYHVSKERLTHHPYLTYKQADKLYTYHRMRHQVSSLEQLPNIYGGGLFTPTDLKRLKPYFVFNE